MKVSEDRFNGVIATLAIKAPCVAVATSQIVLNGLQTVDGFSLQSHDRVLVIGQAGGVDNGIYSVREGVDWVRTPDFDGNRDITRGTVINVDRSVGTSAVYEVITIPDPVIGVDPINFRLWYDSAAGGIGVRVEDEGVPLVGIAGVLNFVGAGVVASGGGATKLITITSGGVDMFADLLDVNPVHDFMYVGVNIDCAQNPFEDWTVLHQVITSGGINEITLDHELGQDIFFALTENVVTVNFTNLPPSGVLIQFEMHLEQDNPARTITWPGSVLWMNGVEIDISTVDSKHVIHFRSIDGGTEWLATYAREFA